MSRMEAEHWISMLSAVGVHVLGPFTRAGDPKPSKSPDDDAIPPHPVPLAYPGTLPPLARPAAPAVASEARLRPASAAPAPDAEPGSSTAPGPLPLQCNDTE